MFARKAPPSGQPSWSLSRQAEELLNEARRLGQFTEACTSFVQAGIFQADADIPSKLVNGLSVTAKSLTQSSLSEANASGASGVSMVEYTARRRSAVAYGHMALLVSRAALHANAAFMTALQMTLSTGLDEAGGRWQYAQSLRSTQAALLAATDTAAQVARGLAGPEPALLADIMGGPLGRHAHDVVNGYSPGPSPRRPPGAQVPPGGALPPPAPGTGTKPPQR